MDTIWKIQNAEIWRRLEVSMLCYDRIEKFTAKGAEVSDKYFGENRVVIDIDFKKLPAGTIFMCNDLVLELK